MKSAPFLIAAMTLLMSSAAFADLKEVPLLKPYEAPIVVNGQRVGSIKLPAGATVEIISEQGAQYSVSRGGEIPFNIPKNYIVASTSENLTTPSQEFTAAKGQLLRIKQQITAFLAHAKQTALENIAVIKDALGITSVPASSTPSSPVVTETLESPFTKMRPKTSAAIAPALAPQLVDHFSYALSSAKGAAPRKMHMSDAFGLADLEKAKAKAIKEKKPLGFIMIWETKEDFFNYSADTRGSYGPSSLLHFYRGFNSNIVLFLCVTRMN